MTLVPSEWTDWSPPVATIEDQGRSPSAWTAWSLPVEVDGGALSPSEWTDWIQAVVPADPPSHTSFLATADGWVPTVRTRL